MRKRAIFLLSLFDDKAYQNLQIKENYMIYPKIKSLKKHYGELIMNFIDFVDKIYDLLSEEELTMLIYRFPYSELDADLKKILNQANVQ